MEGKNLREILRPIGQRKDQICILRLFNLQPINHVNRAQCRYSCRCSCCYHCCHCDCITQIRYIPNRISTNNNIDKFRTKILTQIFTIITLILLVDLTLLSSCSSLHHQNTTSKFNQLETTTTTTIAKEESKNLNHNEQSYIIKVNWPHRTRHKRESNLAQAPTFTEPIGNHTVPIGRDVQLWCKTSNLDNKYRTAWLRVEDKQILSIHDSLITRNYRIGVIVNEASSVLTIKNVQESDKVSVQSC